MATDKKQRMVSALLKRHGRTYAEEAGISLRNSPAPLFQLLVAATLFSARIGAAQGVKATRALIDNKLTTPKKMAEATWEKRVRILNENGYARYDEKTSSMLGDTAEKLQELHGGDLRKLRQEAGRDVHLERELLTRFKGIGPSGADIFLREVQAVWEEVCPYVDARAARGAQALGLPKSGQALSMLTRNPGDMARLAAALVRVVAAGDAADIKRAA